MLESRVLVRSPRVAVVRCAGPAALEERVSGQDRASERRPVSRRKPLPMQRPVSGQEEPVSAAALVLVRRGVFVRWVAGRSRLADVITGYLQRPGEWQRIDHPCGGDVCTSVALSEELAERFAHTDAVRVSPAADLAHRRLLAAGPADRADLAVGLIDALLPSDGGGWAGEGPGVVGSGAVEAGVVGLGWHPAVELVREMLHTDPERDLAALASEVGWSPWWLSRRFRAVTGETLNDYRQRLRVRVALDSLGGDARPDLAELAVRCGFADQAHLTRAVRRETGLPPGALHRALRGG